MSGKVKECNTTESIVFLIDGALNKEYFIYSKMIDK